MIDDFKELLSEFNAEGVRYLVVGGYAVSLHAQPRATKDLDILIGYDSKNGEAVFRALARFGAPLENRSPADFAEAGKFFRMGAPPFMIDLMSDITGVDFEDAWSRRVAATVDAAAGLDAWSAPTIW